VREVLESLVVERETGVKKKDGRNAQTPPHRGLTGSEDRAGEKRKGDKEEKEKTSKARGNRVKIVRGRKLRTNETETQNKKKSWRGV